MKIALRNIRRHKGYSLLNILGLAIGMACCILILLWVQDELSYDHFNENVNYIYRVIEDWDTDITWTPGPLAQALKEDFPEINDALRILFRNEKLLLRYGEKSFYEEGGIFADPSLFEIFSFPFHEGSVFSDPYSIVLTKKMGQKYFGNDDPIGKTVRLLNDFDLKVTGIIENIPHNSHLQFDFVVPAVLFKEFGANLESWNDHFVHTYIMLEKEASFQDVNNKIEGYMDKYYPEGKLPLYLQPLKKTHLYSSHILSSLQGKGDIKYVYIFSTIALFVLVIACINFMNLTTARSGNRAKEIGLRKVIGSYRSDIIKQFLSESVLLSFIALVIAVGFVSLILPAFNNISGKDINTANSGNIYIIVSLIGIALLTGLLSGSYPAIFLSAFQPVTVLKGTLISSLKNTLLRRILCVVQSSLSIILIICTFVISSQINYIRNKDLGYKKDHVFCMQGNRIIQKQIESFKTELLQNSDVIGVATSNVLPVNYRDYTTGVDWEGKDPNADIAMFVASVDHDYISTMGMEMIAGRDFSIKYSTDASSSYILNEEAAKLMGSGSPVDKQFTLWGDPGKIIGVVKNFHFKTLHEKIAPVVLRLRPKNFRYVFVKTKSENISVALSSIEGAWKKFSPGYPFEYKFLDETLYSLYKSDQRIDSIVKYFTFIVIFVSCLGLLGLSAFMAEKRTREIGIRKVLGASMSEIAMLLSKEHMSLVVLANIVAWPAAYYAMNKWLQNFAYHTTISIWMFILSAALTMLIALLTVGYLVLKAAAANPVDSLRYE